jgi:hypothetical protein
MTSFNGLVGIVSNLVSVALYISFPAAGPFDPSLFTSGSFLSNHHPLTHSGPFGE